MSWGEYLSNLKKEGLKHAAICEAKSAEWLQISDGSNVSRSKGASCINQVNV